MTVPPGGFGPDQAANLLDAVRGLDSYLGSGELLRPAVALGLLGVAVATGLGVLQERMRPGAPSVRPSAGQQPRKGAGQAEADVSGGGRRKGAIAVEGPGGKEPAPRRWLLDDLVPYGPRPRWRFGWRWPFVWREERGYVTALVGTAGTAKSYLLEAFGVACLTGAPWCGLTPRRLRSFLYVDCELDSETFWGRAYAVARGMGLKRPPRGLHYLNLSGVSLASPEGWAAVRDAVRRHRVEAIGLDSITIGAFTVTTNDAGAMNRLFGSFEFWGVPVFAIDHLGKDPAKGAVGSFMKYAKIRSEVTLRAVSRGLVSFTHSKTNFGRRAESFQVGVAFVGGGPGEGPLTVSFAPVGASSVVPSAPETVRRTDAPSLTPLPLPVLTPSSVPAPAGPARLRVVRTPPGRDENCQKILAFLAAAGDGPWLRPALRDRLIAERVVARTAAYAHIRHLVDDGWLESTEDGGRLALKEAGKEMTA